MKRLAEWWRQQNWEDLLLYGCMLAAGALLFSILAVGSYSAYEYWTRGSVVSGIIVDKEFIPAHIVGVIGKGGYYQGDEWTVTVYGITPKGFKQTDSFSVSQEYWNRLRIKDQLGQTIPLETPR